MTNLIITDIKGDKLKLTASRLAEVDFEEAYRPWYATYADIAAATFRRGILIRETGKPRKNGPFTLIVPFHRPSHRTPTCLGRIGCRYFDRTTFGIIMKAAKVANTKAAAKAAKAGTQ